MKRNIFLRYEYEKIVFVYMLIRYYIHNILANMSKNRNVTYFLEE